MFKQSVILIFILHLLTITVSGQSSKSKDTLLKILTYGAIDATTTHAVNTASKKFGFEYYLVSGYCSPVVIENGQTVVYINVDSINKHNDTVKNLIAKNYGQDWEIKFHTEVERLLGNEQKVRDFILSDTTFTNAHEDFVDDAEDGILRFVIDETGLTNQYFVRVTKQIKKGGKYPIMIVYKLLVDMEKKTLRTLSNKIEPYNRS